MALSDRVVYAAVGTGVVASVILIGAAVVTGVPFGGHDRPNERWELPYAFHGLIVVSYGRSSCPALESRNGVLVYVIPASGELCTSTPFPSGSAIDDFLWIDDRGNETKLVIPDEVNPLLVEGTSKRLYVYVGTPEEQRAARQQIVSPSRRPP